MKVLVAYASRHGATKELANVIKAELDKQGLNATVADVADVDDVSDYEAFVVGSAVYIGSWMGSARKFVDKFSAELTAHPTWLFSSGPIGETPKPGESKAVLVDDIIKQTNAREHKLLSGKLDRQKLKLGEQVIVKAVYAEQGDFRDWDEVKAWAREIASELS